MTDEPSKRIRKSEKKSAIARYAVGRGRVNENNIVRSGVMGLGDVRMGF